MTRLDGPALPPEASRPMQPARPEGGVGQSRMNDAERPVVSNEKIGAEMAECFFIGAVSARDREPETGSLADLAKLEGMPCARTLGRVLRSHPAFPIIRRSGSRFILDLKAAAKFVASVWSDGRSGELRQAARQPATIEALAALPGMPSARTIRKLIARHNDFPLVKSGGIGRAYEVDLVAAVAFVRAHWRDGRGLWRGADETQPDLFKGSTNHVRQ